MPTDAQSFPLPVPSPGYRVSGKEVEVRDSASRHHQLCGRCNLQLIQSHVAPSHGPPARVLSSLSSRQSLSCCLSRVAKRSTPKPHGPLYSPSEPCGPFPHFRTVWSSSPFQNCVALSIYFRASWSSSFPLRTAWSSFLSLWLPSLGLNPSAHLPLQPHFRLLLQSVTPASIPIFFQLYWAAIVSLGRCGPMVWSQSSPSSHAGPVTRGSCFPVPSWVEVTPISLAQSRTTAI